jgi:hypothetical protein
MVRAVAEQQYRHTERGPGFESLLGGLGNLRAILRSMLYCRNQEFQGSRFDLAPLQGYRRTLRLDSIASLWDGTCYKDLY